MRNASAVSDCCRFERFHGIREDALKYLAFVARNYPPIHAAIPGLRSETWGTRHPATTMVVQLDRTRFSECIDILPPSRRGTLMKRKSSVEKGGICNCPWSCPEKTDIQSEME
jgi:hypothetical protein